MALKRHCKAHKMRKPFSCALCGKIFMKSEDFKSLQKSSSNKIAAAVDQQKLAMGQLNFISFHL